MAEGAPGDSVSHGASYPEPRIVCKTSRGTEFPLWCLRGLWRGFELRVLKRGKQSAAQRGEREK